jgi:protein SCO1/2
LISISVDPGTDTPERLRDFAAKFKAQPGWTFITGEKSEIDTLLRALGVAVADKNDHTPMILVGNDVSGFWTRSYGLSAPSVLVNVITEAANAK